MNKPRSDYLFDALGRRLSSVPFTITDAAAGTVVLKGRTTSRGRYPVPRDRRRAYDVTFRFDTRTVRLHYPAEA